MGGRAARRPQPKLRSRSRFSRPSPATRRGALAKLQLHLSEHHGDATPGSAVRIQTSAGARGRHRISSGRGTSAARGRSAPARRERPGLRRATRTPTRPAAPAA
ncbi:glyoxalase superfamily protein [Amycolatopsis acididurans]|uniref:glyoxalase superfamily protein n=1 Tax=Amycolatopsis acididurans TaxID=2724524 RepID=UPI0035E45ABC